MIKRDGCKHLLLICSALMAIALMASAARAQSTTDGAIGGAVTDPSSAVIPDATVSAQNRGTNATASTRTDASGRYILIHLQPGAYDLEVKSPGLTPTKQTNVVVEVGRVTTVDIALAVAGTAETVMVSDEAPVVNTDQQDFAINLNQTSINNLPINGRRWFSYALATPGTVTDGGFGDISFRGISGLMNNNTVDGGDNNQAFFSEEKGRTRIAYSTSQESIQEFQVNTATYSAEYGRAAGGVINAVTKSGTNEIHGGVFYFNRNQSLGAYTPFATGPALVNGSYTQVPIKPLDIRQQLGGDVGGYLIKDKLFFYFNFDEQIRHFPAVATPSNPLGLFSGLSGAEMTTLVGRVGAGTAANLSTAQINQYTGQVLGLFSSLSGTVPRTGNQMLSFPKIDYKFNSANTFTFSYNRLRWTSPYGVQTNSVVARGIDSFGDDFVKDDTGVARWTSIISPSMSNELRFQYSRDYEYEFANPAIAGEPLDSRGYSPDTAISGAAAFEWGQPYYTQRYAYPEERRVQVADTVSWAKGKHLIKAGVDINHVNDLINYLNTAGGEYYYNNRVDFISDFIGSQVPSVFAATHGAVCGTSAAPLPCYNEFQQGFGPPGFQFSTMEYAAFVQDQWRYSSRLTINLGLRYEFEQLPSPQIPNSLFGPTGVFNSNKNNIGPRVGFAWDVTGQGKTSVRGGYGIYYGRIINGTIFNAIANTGVANAQVSATLFPTTAGTTGEPIYPNLLSSFTGSVGQPNIIYFPGDLHNPMIQEYDMVIEHQIAANTVVSLSWIGSLGHFLPTSVDTNLPAPGTISYAISGGPLNGDSVTVPFFRGARPNPNFAQTIMIASSITSNYNAAVVQFNRRMTRGLQFQASYTLADSRDDGQGSSATLSGSAPLDPYNIGLDRGPSNFDIRHRFVSSIVWQPEYFNSTSGVTHALLTGWTMAPIFTAASGLPLNPTVSGNPPSGAGNTGSGPLGAQSNSPTRVPFLERNSFRYPGTWDLDLRIARSFRIWERAKLEIIAEAFNLFNHENFTSATAQNYTIGGTAAAPVMSYFSNFGQLTAANNNNIVTPRQIQFGAKVTF